MQEFFLDPSSPTFTCGAAAILPSVKKMMKAFRDAGRPVIFTRHVHHPDDLDSGIMGWWWEGKCLEGSPESEIHPSIAPRPNEKVVFKHRYSAFYNTDLETVLRCLKVEDLVIAGVMTNMCCESTARDAYYRDYRVFFPGGWDGDDQRGDASRKPPQSLVRFCAGDDERCDRRRDGTIEGSEKPSHANASADREGGTPMTPEEVVNAFVEAVNSGSAENLAAWMTPDHVFVDSDGTGTNGREAMLDGWRAYFTLVPDYRIVVAERFSRGDTVVLLGTATGTIQHDGVLKPENRWSVPAAWRAVVKGEKVAVWQLYVNVEPMVEIMERLEML